MSKSRTVAFYGVAAALLFVLLMLETFVLTLIPVFAQASPAVLSLSMAFSLSMFGGKKSMFFGGTAVGVCSFIIAVMIGNPIFINPVISVLPRVLCGLAAAGVYSLIFRLLKSRSGKEGGEKAEKRATAIASAAGAAVGVLLNTVSVLFTMFLFQQSTLEVIFATLISLNFIFEFVGAILLAPVFVPLLKKYARLG